MTRLPSRQPFWITAAWFAWPVGLLLVGRVLYSMWFATPGEFGMVVIEFEWPRPLRNGWLTAMLSLMVPLAVFFGPPLLLSFWWRRSRANRDRRQHRPH